jgi:monodictyphenone polyketide synthase
LKSAVVTGLGIGLLVSTAVSLASTLNDVPVVGSQILRVAFRLGVLVRNVSQNIEPLNEDGVYESWAYVVHGITVDDAQKELGDIYREKVSHV